MAGKPDATPLASSETERPSSTPVPWPDFRRTWAQVAALSFGGPAGQIAVMHRMVVEERRWLSEERFLHALNYCMLLPGPEAQQLATYIGWLQHGYRGGLLAGGLFILPGMVALLALSVLYVTYRELGLVAGILVGLKPAVLAVVLEAVLRIGRRVLRTGLNVTLALASFVAIFWLNLPFPAVVLGAGLTGFVADRFRQARATATPRGTATSPASSAEPRPVDVYAPAPQQPSTMRSLTLAGVCLGLWFAPLVALRLCLGAESVFLREGLFFSFVSVVTFGGAYAVLAFVAQQAVSLFQWLLPGEMLDGLGLAETTPGPLIMVVQFVGFLGAYRNPGPLSPMLAGILGSLVTTWVTFVPCFTWIFLGAPYIERLRGVRSLSAALSAITSAVVGVILNLAVWFSLHVLFGTVVERYWGPVRLLIPDPATLHPLSLALVLLSVLLLFGLRLGMLTTLGLCAGLGAVSTAL